jgi:hypothetical protein
MSTSLQVAEEMLPDGVVGLNAFFPDDFKWRRDHVCSEGLVFTEGDITLNSLIRLHGMSRTFRTLGLFT